MALPSLALALLLRLSLVELEVSLLSWSNPLLREVETLEQSIFLLFLFDPKVFFAFFSFVPFFCLLLFLLWLLRYSPRASRYASSLPSRLSCRMRRSSVPSRRALSDIRSIRLSVSVSATYSGMRPSFSSSATWRQAKSIGVGRLERRRDDDDEAIVLAAVDLLGRFWTWAEDEASLSSSAKTAASKSSPSLLSFSIPLAADGGEVAKDKRFLVERSVFSSPSVSIVSSASFSSSSPWNAEAWARRALVGGEGKMASAPPKLLLLLLLLLSLALGCLFRDAADADGALSALPLLPPLPPPGGATLPAVDSANAALRRVVEGGEARGSAGGAPRPDTDAEDPAANLARTPAVPPMGRTVLAAATLLCPDAAALSAPALALVLPPPSPRRPPLASLPSLAS